MTDTPTLDPARFPDGIGGWADGYIAVQPMPDGRAWCLVPLTLGRLRIMIAEDQYTPGEHWCYSDNATALTCYQAGPDVTPIGWSRHMLLNGTREYPT